VYITGILRSILEWQGEHVTVVDIIDHMVVNIHPPYTNYSNLQNAIIADNMYFAGGHLGTHKAYALVSVTLSNTTAAQKHHWWRQILLLANGE
jgi:hypothetical protein